MRIGLAVAGFAALTVSAHAGGLPACGDGAVIDSIVRQQAWAEARTWHDGFVISSVRARGETRLGLNALSAVAQRRCRGLAQVAGRKKPLPIYYVISAGEGLAGAGWRIDFCVPGHDRYQVYGNACRVLK